MNEFDFEKLKNIKIDFPESWVENALEIPSKEHKKPAPILFYRYAAGIAACVVMGLAVILTMIFGIGKNNVSLTKPDTDYSSGYSVTPDGTIPSGTGDYNASSENAPVISGADNGTSPAVTEPYENSESGNSNSIQKGTSYANGKSKAYSSDSPNPNSVNSKQKPYTSDNIPQKSTESDEEMPPEQTAEPAEEESSAQNPTEENSPPPETKAPSDYDYPDVLISYSFSTYVDKSLAQNSVYCRIVDENNNNTESMPLYSSGRKVSRQNAGNNKIHLTYVSFNKLIVGKEYSVIFYNAQGTVLKQGTVRIGNYAAYEI